MKNIDQICITIISFNDLERELECNITFLSDGNLEFKENSANKKP